MMRPTTKRNRKSNLSPVAPGCALGRYQTALLLLSNSPAKPLISAGATVEQTIRLFVLKKTGRTATAVPQFERRPVGSRTLSGVSCFQESPGAGSRR